MNNYFDIGLQAWEANIDIQPVFDYCKAITYMCSYLSKEEHECLQVMKQAFKETLEKGPSYYEQMKTIVHAYSWKRECSLPEIYTTLCQDYGRKVFPAVVNVNGSISGKKLQWFCLRGNCHCCQKIVQISINEIWSVVILLFHQKKFLIHFVVHSL